jgi:replication factor C subunit 2/4
MSFTQTWAAGFVSAENVYKVCDQPHPVAVQAILRGCINQDIEGAARDMTDLWRLGMACGTTTIGIHL